MSLRSYLLGSLLAALALPAFAQAPQGTPTRIRGTVERLDGQALVVKSRDGADVSIALAPNYSVSGVAKRGIADIKPGAFIASTSVKGADGKLRALEVHIFPDAMRGQVPELQAPWDLVPDSVMTNAVVTGIVTGEQGELVKMTYKGNETEVVVPADIPIVTYVPGDPGLLKPGAAVFIFALKQPDNTLTAARITAEKDGVKPPM
ncbi:MAG TPA: hypothetical protein VN832_11570 [Stellaceae bacterium]|nr:hypothetical protein [Stellaceae bacterium]